ncbi:uncharacterized protein LOC135577516 isoform X2 [Columba livia]|uniref:uncharacterized protein LOC135577516 isoform X2 n=1 Tax=Columba livia TaxID=8932 RepID=UPI0031B9E754
MSLEESLRRSNARFMATINSILERYNHPFEDDLLISMETLAYSTPDGPKSWEDVSTEDLRKWQEEVVECNRGSERNAEMSKQDNSDFEDGHSTGHQESPETSCVNTSDTGEESDTDTVSVRRKFQDIHLQNVYVRDGKIQEKVKVDVIVQDNVRKIPGWIMRECQGSSKGLHLASPVQELIGTAKSFGGEESDTDTVSVRRKFQDIHLQNVYVRDGKIQEKVKVDVIVQDNVRKIPGWIMRECQGSSKGLHLASPVQELIGTAKSFGGEESDTDTVSVRRKFQDIHLQNVYVRDGKIQEKVKVDVIVQDNVRKIPGWIMRECQGSSKGLHLASPVQELIGTAKSFGGEESDTDTVSVRRKFQDIHLQNVYVRDGKIQEKVKVDVIVQDNVRKIPGWIMRECQGSSKGLHLASPVQELIGTAKSFGGEESDTDTVSVRRKFQDIHLQNVYVRDGKIQEKVKVDVIVQDNVRKIPGWIMRECQGSSKGLHLASPVQELIGTAKSFGGEESDTDTVSVRRKFQDIHLQNVYVRDGKIQEKVKVDVIVRDNVRKIPGWIMRECQGSSKGLHLASPVQELIGTAKSFGGEESDTDTVSVRRKFQDIHLQNVYVRDGKIQEKVKVDVIVQDNVRKIPGWIMRECQGSSKGLHLASPVQELIGTAKSFGGEESDTDTVSVRRKFQDIHLQSPSKMPQKYNDAFEKLYYKLCPQEIQKPFILTRSLANSQNLEVKRLRGIPERYLSSTKCEQIAHRRNAELQTDGMTFLNLYIVSNSSIFDSHNCQSQGSGFHAVSDKTFLGVPGTSLQESGIAGTNSGWPSAVKNYSSPRNAQYCRKRVSRKLSYTVGKDDKSQQSLG